ncbi:hypothetical protein DL346_21865 [Paenibacillus montanisoli]|uniref:Uncharacterized protein n=1 Tax=Paenibacillus montanisoli TaxID=2081970 RepID=A0A328TY80_9BACL|nr:hypothetical protein DL346_21865 [Paenibacillus montanisoli]
MVNGKLDNEYQGGPIKWNYYEKKNRYSLLIGTILSPSVKSVAVLHNENENVKVKIFEYNKLKIFYNNTDALTTPIKIDYK